MQTFPYFKTRFQSGECANVAKVAKLEPKTLQISTISTFSKQAPSELKNVIEVPLLYSFNWYLRKLRNTHDSNLPLETLEAIAFHRTACEWINQTLQPMAQYDARIDAQRHEQARVALIAAGLKPCKRLQHLMEGQHNE